MNDALERRTYSGEWLDSSVGDTSASDEKPPGEKDKSKESHIGDVSDAEDGRSDRLAVGGPSSDLYALLDELMGAMVNAISAQAPTNVVTDLLLSHADIAASLSFGAGSLEIDARVTRSRAAINAWRAWYARTLL